MKKELKIREKDKEVILRKKKYYFSSISLSLEHVAVFFQIRQFRTLECHNEDVAGEDEDVEEEDDVEEEEEGVGESK